MPCTRIHQLSELFSLKVTEDATCGDDENSLNFDNGKYTVILNLFNDFLTPTKRAFFPEGGNLEECINHIRASFEGLARGNNNDNENDCTKHQQTISTIHTVSTELAKPWAKIVLSLLERKRIILAESASMIIENIDLINTKLTKLGNL